MAVPLMDLSSQHGPLMGQFESAFSEAVRTNRFVLGPAVESFEQELAAYCGAAHAVGLSSGTDALIVALMVLGVGPGDEVITSPFSFFATAGSIARVGAVPVFVDIDLDTFNLDPAQIESAITAKTKAIMPVHLFGQCAAMGPIMAIGAKHGLPVIEDAAQAIGARDMGGGLKVKSDELKVEEEGNGDEVCREKSGGAYGEIGCLSFYPTKNLSAFGDGGACLTNDAALAAKIRSVRQHGESSRYQHATVGGNFRLDAIQASMLSIKLPHLDGWVAERRAIAGRYNAWLADVPGIVLPVEGGELDGLKVKSEKLKVGNRDVRENVKVKVEGEMCAGEMWGGGHVFNQYTLRVEDGKRDALMAYLGERKIGCKVYYPLALHEQPCFAQFGQADKALPNTRAATQSVLSIPMYPGLSQAQQREVADAIVSFADTLKVSKKASSASPAGSA